MIEYELNSDEQELFYFRVIASIAIIALLIYFYITKTYLVGIISMFVIYAFLIALFFWFRNGLLVGYLRGNAVKISPTQFPDIYNIAFNHCSELGINKMPSIFILQNGGVLNAFATRCSGKDYIAIYSSILELAYEKGQDVVSFIIGHELGHIKRNHVIKNFLCFPSLLIPFLHAGYSRACEYTCDNIGHALSPTGSKEGILILSIGKSLFNKINIKDYLQQIESEDGFWVWFSEIISSHPNSPKRIKSLKLE